MGDASSKQELCLPYPVSVNRYWRHAGNRVYLGAEGREYKYAVHAVGKQAGVRVSEEPVFLHIVICPRTTKSGEASKVLIDIDNGCKVILDALQGVLYAVDSQVKRLLVEYGEPVENGGAIVTVEKLP